MKKRKESSQRRGGNKNTVGVTDKNQKRLPNAKYVWEIDKIARASEERRTKASLGLSGWGNGTRPGVRPHCLPRIGRWIIGRLVGLQSSQRLRLCRGLRRLRLRMGLGSRGRLISSLGRHDGPMLHDLDVELIALILELLVRILLIILEPIGLPRIHFHFTTRREVPTIDPQTTAPSNTSSK